MFSDLQTEYFFLGGADLAAEGEWSWYPNGKKFNYTNWLPKEPDNGGHIEKCLHLYIDLQWNDVACLKEFYFICENISQEC